jgi:hypothetical protein
MAWGAPGTTRGKAASEVLYIAERWRRHVLDSDEALRADDRARRAQAARWQITSEETR